MEYDATGKFSKAAETRKKKAYAPAKAWEEAWWRGKIRLIPLASEIPGVGPWRWRRCRTGACGLRSGAGVRRCIIGVR